MRFYLLALTLTVLTGALAAATNWNRLRGPNGSGVAPAETGIPTKFGPEENVACRRGRQDLHSQRRRCGYRCQTRGRLGADPIQRDE